MSHKWSTVNEGAQSGQEWRTRITGSNKIRRAPREKLQGDVRLERINATAHLFGEDEVL